MMYYFIGLLGLILVKVRTVIRGYRNPKPFSNNDLERCVEYDLATVTNWIQLLDKLNSSSYSVKDKSILELGPGSDIGNGLALLARGAKYYMAVDANNLITQTPANFYSILISRLRNSVDAYPYIDKAAAAVERLINKTFPDNLQYYCNSSFDLEEALIPNSFDLVVSQAAFEHFNDINLTIKQLSQAVVTGGKLLIVIDLMTHTRWIRERDPNNIYRYQRWMYNLLDYPGIPNRKRPFHYVKALEQSGWVDIHVHPIQTLGDYGLTSSTYGALSHEFRDTQNQMDYLEVAIYATKQ